MLISTSWHKLGDSMELDSKELELVRSALYTHLKWVKRCDFQALAIETSELLHKVSSAITFDKVSK